MLIRKTVTVFILFLILSPILLGTSIANPESIRMFEKDGKHGLVDNLKIRAWRIPLGLQIFAVTHNIPLIGFGTIDVENKNNCSITLCLNDTVRWQDGTVIGTSQWPTFEYTPDTASSYTIAYPRWQVREKVNVIGFYTLEVELYVKEDGSSKTITYPGIMMFYFTWLFKIPIQQD